MCVAISVKRSLAAPSQPSESHEAQKQKMRYHQR
jgi:hypothetical protein